VYIEVQNAFSFVREGDLPIHLLKLFNFYLRNDLYMARKLPNLPMKGRSIYFPQWRCFLTGALPLLIQKYQCHLVDNRIRPAIDKTKIVPPDWLRPKQRTAFDLMLRRERGIINHTTSTGKTFLASAWVHSLPINHLVIVHRKEILFQFLERFADDLDEDVDLIWGSNFDYKQRRVALGMIQSIAPRVSSKEIDIKHYNSIVVDESHHIGWGTQYVEPLILSDAYFRFGLTATVGREAGDTIVQVGMLGPILHTYSYEDAVADKFITPVRVFIIRPNWRRRTAFPIEPYARFYKNAIVENKERNEIMADVAMTCIMAGRSTLIILEQIGHINDILMLIRAKMINQGWSPADAARKIDLVHGKDPDRLQKKEDFENGTLRCLISTSLYDEGVDIHAISAIILGAGQHSSRAVIQRIGRGQRLDDIKQILLVFDFWDDFHHKTQMHSEKRLKIFKKQGYAIEVVNKK
jgi:superfamily II DNA or RNA helicase